MEPGAADPAGAAVHADPPGRREVIDHVLASRLLVTVATQVTTALAAPAAPRSITDHPGEEVGKPGSDHAAVIAGFELPDCLAGRTGKLGLHAASYYPAAAAARPCCAPP